MAKRIPEESNEYWAHEQSASGSHPEWVADPNWLDGIPGLYSLSGLEKRSREELSEDRARREVRRRERRERRAKEDEERRAQDAEEQQRRISNGAAMLKVAPSQLTEPEVEALAWAKGYFQDKADEVSHDGSKRYAEKEHTKETGEDYEYWLNHGREPLAEYLLKIRSRRSSFDVVELAAILIQRGDQFPNQELRDFIAGFLRKHNKKSKKRGPKEATLEQRDHLIAVAVRYIIERWGLSIVKNEGTGRASAASIVADCLNMGEKAVNKICTIDWTITHGDKNNNAMWLRYFPIMEGDFASRNLPNFGPKPRKRRAPQIKLNK
jgi:hypothetical protein